MSGPFDVEAYLREHYQGEVLGVALFAQLAELEDDADRASQWRLLERHERHVGARLQRELEERGFAGAPDPVRQKEGRATANALHELDAEARNAAFASALGGFVERFRQEASAAPAEFGDLTRFVVEHEVALLDYFAAAADAPAAAAAIIERFLDATGAAVEPPIPDGLALTPIDPAFRADPNASFRVLHERAPVHRDRGMANRVVLSRHDDVMRVLRDLEFWSDPRRSLPDDPIRMFLRGVGEEEFQPSMLFLDDPEHRRLRNLVSRSFTPRAIEHWRPAIAQVARELVDAIEAADAPEFDLMDALAAPLPAIAIARLLGVDSADQAKFKLWSVASSEAFFNPFIDEHGRQRGELAGVALDAYFRAEVEQRRREPSEDLIGQMVTAELEGDQLSVQEIITMCNLLLIAGNVTTTDLIGNGVRALLDHPEQHRRLRERPELIANAVEEMLRFDPPVTSSGRIAPRDIEIDGIPIRQGESITVLLAAANRDPAVYPDPDRFDIERADTHHQSFGGGAHLCLGAHLARLEAQEAIGALVGRFGNLRPVARPLVYKQVPGFRGLAEYWVTRGD